MKLIKTVSLILVCLLLSLTSKAEYTQTCKIKYKKEFDEWSDYYKVDVHFLSGSELNTKTQSYNYDSYSTYATIFWGDKKVTVIKLSSYMGCGSNVSQDCITNKYSNLEGADQNGRAWEICVKSNCY